MLPCFESCPPGLPTKAHVPLPMPPQFGLVFMELQAFPLVFGVLRGPGLNPYGVWCDRGWRSILTIPSTAVAHFDGA